VDPMPVYVAKCFEQQRMFVCHGVHSKPCAWIHARAAQPRWVGVWRGV